jgi:UDP-N-acetylmuramoyl-tripeptide--D-alanyl-D-alanine ligase
MAVITVEDIIDATGGQLLTENLKFFDGVSIDTRTISEGDLFFAIRGENFDGYEFLEEALLKGRGAVVESRPPALPKDKVIIYVSDTLRSLQDLAYFLRKKHEIPVVAVTGSNGKTTTKEMIYAIVSRKFKTLKNEGNLNNHIGLPLSLTRLQSNEEIIVLEMGMNSSGEIRRLCEIAVPSHGVITNIGKAHLGRLGSYEAVRDAKLEILEGLSVAIINSDDADLTHGVENIKEFSGQIITFAINNSADITASDLRTTKIGSDFILDIQGMGSMSVSLGVFGHFNVYNALAAAAVSFSLGMNMSEIKAGLEAYTAFPMRFEILKAKEITLINDSYNSNPSSVEESIKELFRLGDEGRRVAVLGDMYELDAFSETAHRDVGKLVCEAGLDVFVAVGEMMGLAADEIINFKGGTTGPEVFRFNDVNEAKENIMDILNQGDTVLIKGSRGMAMERIVERITDAI